MLAEFHFLRPLWLLALLPLAMLLWFALRPQHVASAWHRVCDAHLLPHLLVVKGGRNNWPLVALGLGWLVAVMALAGPTWSKRHQPVLQSLDSRVIVLDLSRSMAAPDLNPNRLVRARFKIADILGRSTEGQTGLVVFAGEAFVVSPLTQDADTIASMLAALEPSIMPVAGSRADLGIYKAAELLKQAGLGRGEILLVADSSRDRRVVDAARSVRAEGFNVSVLGVGTREGAPIPARDGGFVKDAMGSIVVPRLDEPGLRGLARVGGGRYATISGGDADIDFLLAEPAALGLETREVDRETESWREEGPWFVLALLPLAALAFRRGWLLALTAWVMISPDPSWALSWADLWARRDQQAVQALEEGEPARAAELARDPMLRGTAAYRSGDYEGSLESFAMASGADADYNRGNALAELGRYEEAIAAYEAALAEEPGLEDAEFNRQAITELLRRQQAQQTKGDGAEGDDQQARQNQDGPRENTATGRGGENQHEEEAGSQRQDATGAGMGGAGANPEEEEASAATGSKPDQGEGEQSDAGGDASDPTPGERTEGGEPKAEPGAEAPPKPVGGDTERADEEGGHGVAAQPGAADTGDAPEREAQQVVDQWLRRIPDDPGGLLRRKFLRQHQRLGAQRDPTTEEAW